MEYNRAEKRIGSLEVPSGYLMEEEVGSHPDLKDRAKIANHSQPSAYLSSIDNAPSILGKVNNEKIK